MRKQQNSLPSNLITVHNSYPFCTRESLGTLVVIIPTYKTSTQVDDSDTKPLRRVQMKM